MEVGYGGGGGGVYVRSKVINIKWEFGPWESISPSHQFPGFINCNLPT